jgi:hypothetical protein
MGTFFITIGLIIFFVVMWILIMPLSLHLKFNTETGFVRVVQPGTFGLLVLLPELRTEFTIFGIRITTRSSPSPEKEPQKKKKKSKFIQRPLKDWVMLLDSIRQSFHVRRLHVDVDSGDVVTNAKLLAMPLWLCHAPCQLTVNFQGALYADVEISFQPWRTLAGVIRFILKF